MRLSPSERMHFFNEMALRNEQSALKAATVIQYLRYSRMEWRYKLLAAREWLKIANKEGRDARSSAMKAMAYASGHFKRYDKLYREKGVYRAIHC